MAREPYTLRTVEQRDKIAALVAGLDMSKAWSVIVEPFKKKRSLSANALYWKWVTVAAHETGNSQDDMHEALKQKFCPPRIVQLGDEERAIYTTTKFTTAEMKEYMDKCYAFIVSELGIYLPLPEEAHLAA